MDIQQIWQDHGTTILVVGGLAVVIGIAYKMLKPKQKVIGEDMTLNVKCSCGWQGTVTKYNQTCRKCGGTDLSRY